MQLDAGSVKCMKKDDAKITAKSWTCQAEVPLPKKAAAAAATTKAATSAMTLVATAATFVTTASMM